MPSEHAGIYQNAHSTHTHKFHERLGTFGATLWLLQKRAGSSKALLSSMLTHF